MKRLVRKAEEQFDLQGAVRRYTLDELKIWDRDYGFIRDNDDYFKDDEAVNYLPTTEKLAKNLLNY